MLFAVRWEEGQGKDCKREFGIQSEQRKTPDLCEKKRKNVEKGYFDVKGETVDKQCKSISKPDY